MRWKFEWENSEKKCSEQVFREKKCLRIICVRWNWIFQRNSTPKDTYECDGIFSESLDLIQRVISSSLRDQKRLKWINNWEKFFFTKSKWEDIFQEIVITRKSWCDECELIMTRKQWNVETEKHTKSAIMSCDNFDVSPRRLSCLHSSEIFKFSAFCNNVCPVSSILVSRSN